MKAFETCLYTGDLRVDEHHEIACERSAIA
jgi:hypothetical protein